MTEQNQLLRSLSLLEISFYGIGTILGAGIYVLLGKVANESGMATPSAFLLSTFIVSFSAYSYAHMSRRFPSSAGEAVYIMEGLNSRQLSALTGVAIALSGIVSAATIARGFTGYFAFFSTLPPWALIILLVTALTALAAWGVKQSVTMAVITTLLEIAGLVLVLIVGSDQIQGKEIPWRQFLPSTDPNTNHSFIPVISGAFIAFFAFIGFEDMVTAAEEVKDPVKNMPKAILFALVIATLLYFLITFLCIATVPPDELAQSKAPLALVYERVTGNKPVLISVIGIFAVVNGALIQIIMASRIFYGLSREGWLPELIGRANTKTKTPVNATVMVSIMIIIMALWLPIETLAKATSFLLFILFTMVNLALWRIKQREQSHPENIIKLPLWMPIAGAITSFAFVIFQIIIETR